jgi:hypothetical protein
MTALIRKKGIDISFSSLTFIYSYKVLFGCIYGFIFLKYYRGDDTWLYHHESLLQYDKLIHHPIAFIKDFLPYSAFAASHNFWQGFEFYIEDLEFYSMTKLLAIFDVFSRGNYYINALFLDSFIFIGPLLLYKLLYKFHADKKNVLILVLFFMPQTIFWVSGIRAEGLLLLFISIIVYYSYKWFNQRKKNLYFFYIIASFIGFAILRSQALLVFIPAYFSFTLSLNKNKKAIYYFACVYIICVAVFLISIFTSAENNLSIPVIKRQQEFFKLHGNTSFKLDSLQPSASSFVKVLPQAFANTFLRPSVWEAKGVLQIFTAFDIILFWLLLIIAIFFREEKWTEIINRPLPMLFLFYGISQTIFIGYVVPFPGAIVRYKSIPEIFLLIVMICITDYHKIGKAFGC